MQFRDPLNIQEVQPQVRIELTMKPNGDFNYMGLSDPEVVEKLLITSEYQRDRHRKAASEAEALVASDTRRVNIMTNVFLGITGIVFISCLFFSFNKPMEESKNVSREFVRGFCR